MLKADLHIHTLYSGDSSLKPAQILSRAIEIGLDVVGIVDHNGQRGGIEAKRIARDYGVVVLVGQEIRTVQGEIAIFGLTHKLPTHQDIIQTCRLAKSKGGLIILPHPFDRFRHSVGSNAEKIVQFVDAVEVFNSHCLMASSNRAATEFAKQHSLPGLAVSDAHRLAEIGSAITYIDARPDQDSIFDSIRTGKVAIKAGRSGLFGRLSLLIGRQY